MIEDPSQARSPAPRCLELRGISKVYETPDGNGVHRFTALDGIDLSFHGGGIHTVLGENGAGKSTLMHVLSGLVLPTAGTISLDGFPAAFRTPAEALKAGIAMVHQRPLLADDLTTLENVLVGMAGLPARRREGLKRLETLAAEWGIPLDARTKARNLTPALRLYAALLSALFRNPDFLVLDEPTSVLAPEDRERFLAAAKRAADRGLGVLLITHKLDEALRWSDRITVLRHGKIVFDTLGAGEAPSIRVSRAQLAALLDPVESAPDAHERERCAIAPALPKRPSCRFRGIELSVSPKNRDSIRGVSFAAEAGEVTGIFGAPGSGLKTLEDLLAGMAGGGAGTLQLEYPDGLIQKLKAADLKPKNLRDLRIAFVPSNRAKRGSDPALTVADMLLPYRQNRFARNKRKESNFVGDILKAERVEALATRGAHTLSGGQLQRLIVARELSAKPAVLILAEPEWGLDVKSVAILRERLRTAAAEGTAVLILTDAPDSMHDDGFYDAVYTLREGKLE